MDTVTVFHDEINPSPVKAEPSLDETVASNEPDSSPEDAFLHARRFRELPVPQEIFDEEQFLVQVTEVYNPYKFWFQLVNSGKGRDLDSCSLASLMNEMNWFYEESEDAEIYVMGKTDVVLGRACAAWYLDSWHRAEIVSELDEDSLCCDVFYIDFGTVSKVYLGDMRFLKSIFSRMPKQALRGRLANIAPPVGDKYWKFCPGSDATQWFLKLVSNKEQHALLLTHDKVDRVFHLLLFEDLVCINRLLAVHGAAIYVGGDWDPFPHPDDCLPTFEMLEKRKFPPYRELVSGHQALYYEDLYQRHSVTDLIAVKESQFD